MLNTHVLEKVDVRYLGIHVDCFLKFDHHISLIVHKVVTRSCFILKCFLYHDPELLFKVCRVRPLLEILFSSLVAFYLKFLVVKMESVERFFTKRLTGYVEQSLGRPFEIAKYI